jgi:hypothetical protein
MSNLDKRLEIIYKEIEKIISLQSELQSRVKKISSENQELTNKVAALNEQLNKARETGETVRLEKQKLNTQTNKEVNNKIEELLSEVERCITLLKK